MSQFASSRPFREVDAHNNFRLEPCAQLHFLGGESLTPSALGLLREICEGTLRGLEILDFLKNLAPSRRNEACAHSRSKQQVFALIEADDEGIKSIAARRVTTDDELLAQIKAVLASSARALARLIDAIEPLGHHAFKAVLLHKGQYGGGRALLRRR